MLGKVAVSWLKIIRLGLGLVILSHKTATLPAACIGVVGKDLLLNNWIHNAQIFAE